MTTTVLANPCEIFNFKKSSNSYGETSLNYRQEQPSASAWSSLFSANICDAMKLEVPISDDVTSNIWLSNSVDSAYKRFSGLLRQLIGANLNPYREEIVERLFELFQDAIDEDPESEGISLDSLNNFVGFINSNKLKIAPAISLTPDNDIYVSWRKNTGHVFSVHFQSSEDTRFVLFSPNIQNQNRKTRISGITTTDDLIKTVEANIKDWLL